MKAGLGYETLTLQACCAASGVYRVCMWSVDQLPLDDVVVGVSAQRGAYVKEVSSKGAVSARTLWGLPAGRQTPRA